MIMGQWRHSMVNLNKLVSVFLIFVFFGMNSAIASSVNVTFTGSIIEGGCNLSLSNQQLFFGVHKVNTLTPSKAVSLQPLIATIICDSPTIPSISVSGTTLNSGNSTVFGDNKNNSVGFMVRPKISGLNINNFYDETLAMKNATQVLVPSSKPLQSHQEEFVIGLVQTKSTSVIPGDLKTKITFTAYFD